MVVWIQAFKKEESYGRPERAADPQPVYGIGRLRKRGVDILLDGLPASPMQIVQAHTMREDVVYMRDYVLNDKGDVEELCFQNVETKKRL